MMDFTGNSTLPYEYSSDSLGWCSLPECAAIQVRIMSFIIAMLTIVVCPMTCYIILKDKELRHSISGILMVNMCLSGVVPALFNGPLSFCYTTRQLFQHSGICIATATISNTNVMVTLTSIAAMAVDRLLSVTLHLRYQEVVTPRKFLIFMAFQWLLCLLIMMVPLFEDGIIWCVKRYAGCGYQESKYSTLCIMLFVYLPSIVAIVISYGRITWLVCKLNKVQHGRQKFTGLRTTVLILITFILYTLPITVYALVVNAQLKNSYSFIVFQDFSTLLLYCGPIINMLTYGGTSKRFKLSFTKFVHASCCAYNKRPKVQMRKVSPAVITVSSSVEDAI